MRTNSVPNESAAIASSHRQKKTWLTTVTVLAALVVFGTITALTMPASTMSVSDIATPETAAAEASEEQGNPVAVAEVTAADTTVAEVPMMVATPESAQNAVVEQAETETAALPAAAQVPEGYTVQRTVRDDQNGFAVTIYAPEGVIPEDATLSATLLSEEEEEYRKAEQALAEQTDLLPQTGKAEAALSADTDAQTGAATYGFAALDIHLEDAEGSEVEPDGNVFVSIEAIGLLPEEADPDSVTVQHHAEAVAADEETGGNAETGPVVTVETVADVADKTEGVVAVTQAEDTDQIASTLQPSEGAPATEVQAAFTVDGFSTFTITWNWQDGEATSSQTVTAYYVDEWGTEIKAGEAENISVDSGNWVELDTSKKEIEGYTLKGIYLNNYDGDAGGVAAQAISFLNSENGGTWQYRATKEGEAVPLEEAVKEIYFVYKIDEEHEDAPNQLETIDTVDSLSLGVHMYMFNYNNKAFSGAEYSGNHGVKQGLATSTVVEPTGGEGDEEVPYYNKFPNLTDDNRINVGDRKKSFSTFFDIQSNNALIDSSTAVNHLFSQEVYDQTGTFYYNGAENFATIVSKDSTEDTTDNIKNFKVYDALGAPEMQNQVHKDEPEGPNGEFFYQRGNFLPYNDLDPTEVLTHNFYDEYGALRNEENGSSKPIYGLKNEAGVALTPNAGAEYWFGMYMYASFYQPKDGQVEAADGTKSNMVFEFTGDDDMWVYIDGVLVLDLGGCHDALSGTINFATGEVRWQSQGTPGSYAFDQSDNLYNIFYKQGKVTPAGWDGTTTFADGTVHTIQMFYMERGRGASNLKLSFNLPTVPDGTLTVTKDVENYFEDQMQDVQYIMQLLDDTSNAPLVNELYHLHGSDTDLYTDDKGQFLLKHGETAVFEGIAGGSHVIVKEVGVQLPDGTAPTFKLEKYGISFVVTDANGLVTDVGEGQSENGAKVQVPSAGSAAVMVNNRATFTVPLVVQKTFSGTVDNTAPEGFEATFTLYEVAGTTETPIGDGVPYSDFVDGTYTFWLESGKTYKVVEDITTTGADGKPFSYTCTQVTVVENETTERPITYEPAEDPYGEVVINQDSDSNSVYKIEFKNVYIQWPDITITKIDGVSKVELQGAEFRVSKEIPVTGGKLSKVYYKYDETAESVDWVELQEGPTTLTSGKDGKFIIHNLEDGTYQLTETKAPAGYQKPTQDITFTVNEGKLTAVSSGNNNDDSFTVTNTTGAELPATGGEGTTLLTIGGLLMMAAAVGGGFVLRRRRERGAR